MTATIDPSFHSETALARFRDRLVRGIHSGPCAAALRAQSSSEDPSSLAFRDQLEARVYESLEQTLEQWKRREVPTSECLAAVSEHCDRAHWPLVFLAASGDRLGTLGEESRALGYRLSDDPGAFSVFGLLAVHAPPLLDLLEPLMSLAGVSGVFDAERMVSLPPMPAPRLQPSLAEAVPTIDPDGVRQRIGVNRCGRDVRVCILDTGVDVNHPDLRSAVEMTMDFTGEGEELDPVGHGTHVAGIVAGNGEASSERFVGVAPAARILSGRVLGSSGSGSISTLLGGLKWALEQRVDIVNLSLGYLVANTDGESLESRACDALVAQGILVVVSAGNDGPGPMTVGIPGDSRSAITVGAMSRQGGVCDFSSRGPTANPGTTGDKPDLIAPGDNVISCRSSASDPAWWPPLQGAEQYTGASGTSMAAPMVTGVAAVLLGEARSQGRRLEPADVKRLMLSTCSPVWGYDPDSRGQGGLNLSKLIAALGAQAASSQSESVAAAQADQRNEGASTMDDQVLSVEELANYLRLKAVTVYKLLRQGKVPGFKVGGAWRFRKSTIDEWIAKGEQQSLAEPEEVKSQAEKQPEKAKDRFAVECGVCGLKLSSPPANSCAADGCSAGICDKCSTVHKRHWCRDHRGGKEPGVRMAAAIECIVCGATPDDGPMPGCDLCGRPICQRCHDNGHPTCGAHPSESRSVSAPTAEGTPAARGGKASLRRGLAELAAAESAFLERARAQFAATSELYHPETGEPVAFAKAWKLVSEADADDRLRKALKKYPEALKGLSSVPSNRELVYTITPHKSLGQLTGGLLSLMVRFMSRVVQGVLDAGTELVVDLPGELADAHASGSPSDRVSLLARRPWDATELSTMLAAAASEARRKKRTAVLALFSPDGWTQDAVAMICPDKAGGKGERFASPNISVILLGPSAADCHFNQADPRAAFVAPLFAAELPGERLGRCCVAVDKKLVGAKYVTLDLLISDLPFPKGLVRTAMESMAKKDKEYTLETIKGVGPTLRRRV